VRTLVGKVPFHIRNTGNFNLAHRAHGILIEWSLPIGMHSLARQVPLQGLQCFGRNIQCEPVRKEAGTREECHWFSHLLASSFKQEGVGTNGIIECEFLSEKVHRA
jgi:hypothetical protein